AVVPGPADLVAAVVRAAAAAAAEVGDEVSGRGRRRGRSGRERRTEHQGHQHQAHGSLLRPRPLPPSTPEEGAADLRVVSICFGRGVFVVRRGIRGRRSRMNLIALASLAGCGGINAEVDYAKARATAECAQLQRCERGYFDATYPSDKDCVN